MTSHERIVTFPSKAVTNNSATPFTRRRGQHVSRDRSKDTARTTFVSRVWSYVERILGVPTGKRIRTTCGFRIGNRSDVTYSFYSTRETRTPREQHFVIGVWPYKEPGHRPESELTARLGIRSFPGGHPSACGGSARAPALGCFQRSHSAAGNLLDIHGTPPPSTVTTALGFDFVDSRRECVGLVNLGVVGR
uniref:Transposase n=1 Tax=Steinernema glaseri TaxID=37863 RepID=A0A1I7XYU8_9BILA